MSIKEIVQANPNYACFFFALGLIGLLAIHLGY